MTGNQKKRAARRRALLTAVCIYDVLILLLVITYCRAMPFTRIELGSGLSDASCFSWTGSSLSFYEAPDISSETEGTYVVWVKTGLIPAPCILQVRDTTPPQGTAEDCVVLPDTDPEPDAFVRDVEDASAVSVNWGTEPDFSEVGTQKASVILRDAAGNETELPFTVEVTAVHDSLTIEAGEPLPDVESWAVDPSADAEYSDGEPEIDTTVPGSYPIEIRVLGRDYEVRLIVADTTAPVFTVKNGLPRKEGEELDPSDFVETCEDVTALTFTFGEPAGQLPVGDAVLTLVGTDASGNSTEQPVTVCICDAVLDLEASGSPVMLSSLLPMLPQSAESAEDTEVLPAGFIGEKVLELQTSEGTLRVGICAADTAAPVVSAQDRTAYIGYVRTPEELVDSVEDATAVTSEFITEPDWNAGGDQVAELRFTDAGGNETTAAVTLHFTEDTEAPKIVSGESVHVIYLGDGISYMKEVEISDNADRDPTITLDRSQVKPNEEGEYPVYYTVEDEAGNMSACCITIKIVKAKVTLDDLNAEIDEWLKTFITDDMTTAQKIRAVYKWVYEHNDFTWESDKYDPIYEAHRVLTDRTGDCFSMNALCYYALQRFGVETMFIQRDNEEYHHYWILVNMGTGWYHLDSMNVLGAKAVQVLMATDWELNEYSTWYWEYDEAVYPEIATAEFHDPDDPNDTYDWCYIRAKS